MRPLQANAAHHATHQAAEEAEGAMTPRQKLTAGWSMHMDEAGRRAFLLTVTGLPTRGTNGSNGLLRMHWAKRKRYSDSIELAVRAASGSPPTIVGKVMLVYTRAHRGRPMDEDNLAASAKPVLDALRRFNVIVDDRPELLTLHCAQAKRKELGCDWKVAIARIEQ